MYYTLRWNYPQHPARYVGDLPYDPLMRWCSGLPLPADTDTSRVRLTLRPFDRRSGEMSERIPYAPGIDCPAMHRSFVDALLAFGVDNLQIHPLDLVDPDDGRHVPDFCAVNVVGLVAAADMRRSRATVHGGGPVIDVAFDRLVIDGAKAHGLPLFRLAEDPTHIWAHAALRDHLISAGFTDLWWLPAERTASV